MVGDETKRDTKYFWIVFFFCCRCCFDIILAYFEWITYAWKENTLHRRFYMSARWYFVILLADSEKVTTTKYELRQNKLGKLSNCALSNKAQQNVTFTALFFAEIIANQTLASDRCERDSFVHAIYLSCSSFAHHRWRLTRKRQTYAFNIYWFMLIKLRWVSVYIGLALKPSSHLH